MKTIKKVLESVNSNSRTGKQTNLYVITGEPGSGKTTTANLLKNRGYQTTIEYARQYIDSQRIAGRTEQIRRNQIEFQTGVLNMQVEQEVRLAPDGIVFLDRALPSAPLRSQCIKKYSLLIFCHLVTNHESK